MDPNFLEELQKLKEQKKADLNKLQDLAQLTVPDFEETPMPEEKAEPQPQPKSEEIVTTGTIQFAKVSPEPSIQPPVPGGRRGKKPIPEEKGSQGKGKKKKNNKSLVAALVAIIAAVCFVGALTGAFFFVRTTNQKDYSYPYWGMGLFIEDGVSDYSFFGKLETITQYGAIGQVQAIAEFEDGNCIKETAYTAEGDVSLYYTHEYDNGFRIASALYQDGQMIQSAKYTKEKDGRIKAITTYYQEENREETAFLTLSDNGNLSIAEFDYSEGTLRKTYDGTLVTESVLLSEENEILLRTVYQYDKNKQLLSQTEYDGSGSVVGRIVNQYNNQNMLTKTIVYDGSGNITNYTTFNYDHNNNPIKEINYFADGTIQSQVLREFNEKNRVSKETWLNTDGSIEFCYGYDYDSNGYVYKSTVYNTDNVTVISQYTLFTRNDAGTVIETNTYSASNSLMEKILYNNNGFMTALYQYNGIGNMVLEETVQYDGKQRPSLKENTYYSDDGKKTRFYSERYDEQGYVIVQIEEDLEQNFYFQRLFEYHEDGWREKETGFDKSGKTLFERRYDVTQHVVAETLFENGAETVHNEYTYDEKDLILLKVTLDAQTNTLTKTSYVYDEEGLLLSSLDSNAQGIPLVKREYDADGIVTFETTYAEDGSIALNIRFEYDDAGRIILEEKYDDEGIFIGKTVYYYRLDGGVDYTIYDGLGFVVEDGRNPANSPEDEEFGDDDSDETNDFPADAEE